MTRGASGAQSFISDNFSQEYNNAMDVGIDSTAFEWWAEPIDYALLDISGSSVTRKRNYNHRRTRNER